jgi:CBS domain-containing protein
MKIEQLMTRSVRTIGLDSTLDTAAELMWRNDCGSLPVVNENEEVVAMLTDRDICMHAWSQGRPLRELSVRGAMSTNVVACRPADSVTSAESLMQAHQVRRLPVVDAQGHPIGVISLSDLSREAVHEHDLSPRELSDDDVVRTLAAVSQPRSENGSARPEAARSGRRANGPR